MDRFAQLVLGAFGSSFFSFPNKLIPFLLAGVICGSFPTSLSAAKPVKPLSKKVLRNIEAKYDRATRDLFSGKESAFNVLALKRLIAQGVQPDVAIAAIVQYHESKGYRPGSPEKRAAMTEMEALFAHSDISGKKGRDILMRAGTAIHARTDRSELHTYQDPNEPVCRAQKTETRRGEQVSFSDPDKLVEHVLLTELKGSVPQEVYSASR
ncbi:MAG: hypothetical protein D6722_18195 [Bacteroidetes bacterium]|nr:MAG: hypothetical protein D6722_18195 [Bacteroidota bacterium]